MKTTVLRSALRTIALAAACGTATSHGQTLTKNVEAVHDGFFHSFWKDSGSASFTLHPGGRYVSEWDRSTQNWVGGKGWNPGNATRVVTYSGHYGVDETQNSYLALYGWTRNPLIEYYVVESYGSYNPATCESGTDHGNFESDGATYQVRRCRRINQPSIDGTQTFFQYFSVRRQKAGFGRIAGTITFANHVKYWASQGLHLGTAHNYQVMATEGYKSAGSSDITVGEIGPDGSRNPKPTTSRVP
jgi:hypothetical protein